MTDKISLFPTDYFKDVIKKVNLFNLPTVIWLVLMYYLLLNWFMNLCEYIIKQNNIQPIIQIPTVIYNYNNQILTYLNEWIPFVFLFGIGMAVAAFFTIIVVNQFTHYISFRVNAAYGFLVFKWATFICITYWAYKYLWLWFPISTILLSLLVAVYFSIKDKKKLAFF